MAEQSVKDLIYFDFAKAASIYSQFGDGLRESISLKKDFAGDHKIGAKLGIPGIAEIGAGLDYSNATSIIESKLLHHDLLSKVEELLIAQALVVNLNKTVDPKESSPNIIRTAIGNNPYILASGHSVIEDYAHIESNLNNFNQLIEFVTKSATEAIKKTPAYIALQDTINDRRKEIKKIADRNEKSIAQSQLDSKMKQIISPKVKPLDDWIINGIKLLIDTFLPNRINFRIYPFESCPSFQIICNLKRDCFVDQDLQHLLYGYGNYPTVPLSVFGLITSLPTPSGNHFNPLLEFEANSNTDKMVFEKAFRTMFGATDELESWMRYSRYPNITIHPIAVFRNFPIKQI